MSEWVYAFHLVILCDQHGNGCVHAERAQTRNYNKKHLIAENVVMLVGVI